MGKTDAAAVATPPRTDAEDYMGQAMVELDRIRSQLTEKLDLLSAMPRLEKLVTELATQTAAMQKRVETVEKKVDSLTERVAASIEESRQERQAIMERLDRPMLFKGTDTFYATFGGRIGEEVRASIRTEVGGVAQQVFTAVDAHMKQNPIQMPKGSAWVPFLTLLSAIASGLHLYMSYQAARNYVPADVKVKVNGVEVPHQRDTAPIHPMNGRSHPMARAA